MSKYADAIRYFEEAIQESDEIITECSPLLQKELTEQKEYFINALSALHKQSELESENEMILEILSHAAGCPYDFYTKKFYDGKDDPNLPAWYFTVCNGDRFTCKRDSERICQCWKRIVEEAGF